MKIYLIAGHSNVDGKDQGVECKLSTGKRIEGKEVAKFVESLHKKLEQYNIHHIVDSYSNTTSESIKWLNTQINEKDIVLDFHFNADDTGKATGSEVLIYDKKNKIANTMATVISNLIGGVLQIKDRGVKTEIDSARGKLGILRINCTSMIIEICFLSNEEDVKKYDVKYDELIDKLAKYLSTI